MRISIEEEVEKELDLSAVKFDLALHMIGCNLDGTLRLTDASLRNLHLGGCHIEKIEAARLVLTG